MITQARVAQLIVHHPGGRRRGSGYLITSTAVLTAAHVLQDAESVEIRFLSGTATAISWEVGSTDIAVVTIPAESEVDPAKFGHVGDHPAILEVQAVGFPRWKMRNDDGTTFVDSDPRPAQRDSYQLRGTAAVLSNIREGTLEIEIQSAPGIEDPWEGMSGAALWAGDRIIGVITAHHPSEGPTRLTAVRARGIAPIPEFSPDVTAAVHRLTRAYQAQLADIAPHALFGRLQEMADLTRFCQSDAPYGWWQAGPWAGKTALLSSFALSPPSGVDVVSFFITNRFAGQSDSAAFTDALLEQLGVLAGEPAWELLQSRSPHREVLRLLKEVAAKRRLVLVVDGLDEDTSTAMGLPSIAALLPARSIPGLRILVASRPHPDLPDDVPADHLLRSTEIWQLPVYSGAHAHATTARAELMLLLKGPPFQQRILGLITAAGGLNLSDLAELTGESPFKVSALFAGKFGRSLRNRLSTRQPGGAIYLFAHETLRVIAEQEFGAELAVYRDQLHHWGDGYQKAGWPASTPAYMIRNYPRLLAQDQDIPRMLALALDRTRHDWLLGHTGGDALAFAEIAAVARLLAEQSKPDFVALVRLALVRDLLVERNANIPAGLPAAWVALGRPERGIALAEAITVGSTRTEAINKLVGALAAVGLRNEAIALASEVVSAQDRSRALDSVVTALLASPDHDWAEGVARGIPDPLMKDWALCRIAAFRARDPEWALELVDEISSPRVRARALAALACSLHSAGHPRPDLLDRAMRTTEDIDRNPDWDLAVGEVARARAMTGDLARARRMIDWIRSTKIRTWFLAEFIGIARLQGVDVVDVARDALDAAQTIESDTELSLAAWPLLVAYAPTDVGLASSSAAKLPTEFARDWTHAGLALRDPAHLDKIVNPDRRDFALNRLRKPDRIPEIQNRAIRARAFTEQGMLDQAQHAVRAIADPYQRARSMTELAAVVPDGVRLAVDSEAAARGITSAYSRSRRLGDLVEALAGAGDHSTAGKIAPQISDPSLLLDAIYAVVGAHIEADEDQEARALARIVVARPAFESWDSRPISILIKAGIPEEAIPLAEGIAEPDVRRRATLDVLLELTPEALDGSIHLLDEIAFAAMHQPVDERFVADVVRLRIASGELDAAALVAGSAAEHGQVSQVALIQLADAGRLVDALAIVRELDDPLVKVEALCALRNSPGAGNGQLLGEAEEVARAMADPLAGLCEVAKAYAISGRTKDASRIVAEVSSQVDLAGRDDIARRIESIQPYLRSRDRPFDVAAAARSRRDDFYRALKSSDAHELAALMSQRVAEHLPNPDPWAIRSLISEIKWAGLSPGDESIALSGLSPLFVAVLSTSDWSMTLPVVARLAPETLQVVREALLGQHPD
jgi:hypothetical protein